MSRRLAIPLLAATLALLLAHALFYRFLCDDAFISFRYASNLAHGHGLVFNPGHERVEGYTNFLWVLVLAGLDALGLRPEHAAPALGLLLTAALWAVTARVAWRILPAPYALLVLFALALTRSVAVWSTSGLETRLFEVLVLAAVYRSWRELEAPGSTPWSALLFGLGALTRPDGLLIAMSALAAACGWEALRRRISWRGVASRAALFGVPVGAHLLFRVAYYGAWLPNTYYAKIGGRSWWSMGGAYLASFAIEYALVLWVPLLVIGIRALAREGRGALPLLAAAVVLPHALYVASIGGDHFEYRPLDLYFPFALLLVGRGLASLALRTRSWVAAAYAAVLVIGLSALPLEAHTQFPQTYRAGYPGRARARADRERFLDPALSPVYRWPLLRGIGRLHRRLLDTTTEALVGVRQEEHALFYDGVEAQGRALKDAVDRGLVPPDAHIGICAVGAIPYLSGLRTLDRLGLTDAVVAHQPPAGHRVMAHERYASYDYATRAGVELWSVHPYFLLLRLDDDTILWHANVSREDGDEVFVADVSEDTALVALLPQGRARAAMRFPNLQLRSLADPVSYASFVDRVVAACRARAVREPAARDAKKALAMALNARGDSDEALAAFRELAAAGDEDGWYNAGTILAQRGDFAGAIDALRRAVEIDPGMVPARHNLGMVLARAERFPEALEQLREAVRLEPASPEALFALGAVALGAGEREEARGCQERLAALDTPGSSRLASRLLAALGGQ
jgi:hypothetical protein